MATMEVIAFILQTALTIIILTFVTSTVKSMFTTAQFSRVDYDCPLFM